MLKQRIQEREQKQAAEEELQRNKDDQALSVAEVSNLDQVVDLENAQLHPLGRAVVPERSSSSTVDARSQTLPPDTRKSRRGTSAFLLHSSLLKLNMR